MVVSKMLPWRVAAGMLVAALVGCGTTETQPSASVTSLAPNAQHWFRVSWTAEPDRNGERRLHGYVESSLGEWLPGMIPALGRAYFEVPKMPPAPQYRVTVWAYDRIKGGGGG